ncbi:oligopeptide transporter OPT family [Syncephalis pseudoplumigaleata]|uniref:Oligopeptide transporter OPT family n=1 Tax=Syncephalis pseudoplumigaleata TaxID=1712513 RepID=A0A4P9Z0L1_9FUNG|nr:oligopeptide transporter OPT family [Syncephalis pseudoplumigaleata]|eukprot:RKP26003.1 oligopeptide transporter OPT family [Syncephalis pseudoplumigaleata]
MLDTKTGYLNEDGEEDSPYLLVRAAVSNKDDPSLPTLTFRFWLISIPFTVFVSVFNQIFSFRTLSIGISGIIIQLITLPIGRALHRWLPDRRVGLGPFGFSLNPGPFNAKEHALIVMCVGAGTGVAYAVYIITIKHIFYKEYTPILGSILLTVTTQCVGYGLAGVFYRFLVRSSAMIWPSTLVSVTLLRTFHEADEGRALGRTSRMRFFLLVTLASALYYFLPGYLMTMLSTVSVLCIAMPNNVLANRLGSYTKGMGLLSFSLDWNAMANPLMTPFWAIANTFAGFVLMAWIVWPVGYFSNVWNALDYPFYGARLYTDKAEPYPTLKLLNPDLSLNEERYAQVGAPRMSFMFAATYGVDFAVLSSVFMYVVLHHGSEILQYYRDARTIGDDIHARLMERYPTVPHAWYLGVLAVSTALAIFTCEYYGTGLPWWGVLLALLIAALFLLPVGIITAVANSAPALNVISEFVIGFILPGQPIANVTFKTYCTIGMDQALTFLADFKLGHYMKIPPRHMFIAQLTGTLVAGVCNVLAAYWMFNSMPDLCKSEAWYCRGTHVFFSASVIWGVIGPNRMFGSEGYYSVLMWFFLVGLLLPIPFWLLSRRYPTSWVKYISVPVILSSGGGSPPSYSGVYPMYMLMGVVFQFYLFRYRQKWWSRYNYVLSAGLDAGVAITSFIIFFALTRNNIELDWWGNQPDCPLLENTL